MMKESIFPNKRVTMKSKAIYAGTFDPYTNGHQDILERSLRIFDEVTVLIAVSAHKTPMFTTEQRMEMLKSHFSNEPRVRVDFWGGLLVDYARKNKIDNIIRGLRPTGDFEIEFQMASMNNKLYPEIETVFLMTEGQNYFISSTLVREIFHHGGDISDFVPDAIRESIKKLKS